MYISIINFLVFKTALLFINFGDNFVCYIVRGVVLV